MHVKDKERRAVVRSAAILTCLILAASCNLAHAAANYDFTILAKDGDSIGGQRILLPQGGGINASGTAGVNIYPCKGKPGTIVDGAKLFAPGTPVGFGPHGGIAFDCGLAPASPFTQGTSVPLGVCNLDHILAQPGTVIGGHTLTAANLVGTTRHDTVVLAGDFDPNSRAIFRLNPSRVLVQPGDTIGGHHIDVVARAVVSHNGLRRPHFVDPNGSQGWGIFKRSHLVFREGDLLGGQATTIVLPVAVGDDGSILLNVTFAQTRALVVAQRGTEDSYHHSE